MADPQTELADPGLDPRHELLVRTVGLLSVVVGGVYLLWRVGWTVNTDALWLSLPLLLAELHGWITSCGYLYMTWDVSRLPQRQAPHGKTVDFFITTYTEPMSVVGPTIAGAIGVRYPHRTYVLDDGRRPWVQSVCRQLGAKYVTRQDNSGAKAGNINAALKRTTGEFICVVDADFIPSPDFIDQVLGYFDDPDVALVQGPQEFYNLDSFQHLRGDAQNWHEQSVFFHAIQPGKNHENAAFWCGCPSILRRSALDSVGGVASETVTEDLHTSIKLHSGGWKTIYHPDIIALGIAPNDYDGFIMQRLRWAEGTMQVIRRAWATPKLTLGQRVNYIASTGTYFDAVRKALFLSIIPMVLLSDQLPVTAPMAIFLPLWALQFVLSTVATTMLARGHSRPLMTEFFDSLKMFAFIRASGTLISGKRVKFHVTPKGQRGERGVHALLLPFAGVIVVYAFSVGVGLLRLADLGLHTDNPDAMLAAVLWGLAILVFVAEVFAYGYRKVSQRASDRVPVQVEVAYTLDDDPPRLINLRDLTTSGASFTSDVPLYRGTKNRRAPALRVTRL